MPELNPLVIIVSGPPASGKTTLARQLARELALPLLYKDGIKEALFDSLGWRDRAWSRKMGLATYGLLFYFLEAQLAAGQSLIVESYFHPEAAVNLRQLQAKYPYRPFQVLCRTEGSVLLERFTLRAADPDRHPGHVDLETVEELKPVLLKGGEAPLDIGGEALEIDTTDFSKLDIAGLCSRLKEILEAS
jgi:predicted kinase